MGAKKRVFWHHLRGANQSTTRYRRSPRGAPTSGYFRATLRVANAPNSICLRYTLIRMATPELISEIIATYERHGWKLRRVLLRPETRTALAAELFGQGAISESDFDALWFARSSQAGREAWELRLVAELRY